MTPTQAFVAAILVALISAGGTGLTWLLGRGARRVAERVQEHDKWMENAENAYERSEKRAESAEVRAEKAEEKCELCYAKLDRVLAAFYGLLEDLEDQIIPMLMVPLADHQETRIAVRVAMRRAREKAAQQ